MDPWDATEFIDASDHDNSVEKEIGSYLSKIKDAVSRSGNIKRDIKTEILSSVQKIEELVIIIPTRPAQPTTHSTIDTATLKSTIRECIQEELRKIKIPAPVIKTPPPPPIPTYANIASSIPNIQTTQLRPPPYKPAIIVSAKGSSSPSDTIAAWQKNITFKDTNFAPENVRPVSNNKIRVEFNKVEEMTATLNKIRPSSEIAAEPSKKLQPMIILKGISCSTTPDTLTTIIRRQNDSIRASKPTDFNLKFQRGNRNKHLYNAIFTTTPALWRSITEAGKLNVDHQRVHAENYVPVLQCFQCLQYGHTKKWCKEINITCCSHCSSLTHNFKDCPGKNDPTKLNCLNCKKRNIPSHNVPAHSATSNKCPCHINMTKVVCSRIDYGQ